MNKAKGRRKPTQTAMDFGGEDGDPVTHKGPGGMSVEQARKRGYRVIIMARHGELCACCEHAGAGGVCGLLNIDVNRAQAMECDALEWVKRTQQAA